MIKSDLIEEIIYLIDKKVDLEILQLESGLSMEAIQNYQKQLAVRKKVNEAIKNGNVDKILNDLKSYIEENDYHIVEKFLFLKLNAYKNREILNERVLAEVQKEAEDSGISQSLDGILNRLNIVIPKRKKNSGIKKKASKVGKNEIEQNDEIEVQENDDKIPQKPIDYEAMIEKYQEQINQNIGDTVRTRNFLAFTYLKSGKIEEARNELLSLIEETNNYTAYRQLIYLEKKEKNYDDAKLYAYECIDKFSNPIEVREQLISIAREENDREEIIEQLQQIYQLNPKDLNTLRRLKKMESGDKDYLGDKFTGLAEIIDEER